MCVKPALFKFNILNEQATYNFCMIFFLCSQQMLAEFDGIGRGNKAREHAYYDYWYDNDDATYNTSKEVPQRVSGLSLIATNKVTALTERLYFLQKSKNKLICCFVYWLSQQFAKKPVNAGLICAFEACPFLIRGFV